MGSPPHAGARVSHDIGLPGRYEVLRHIASGGMASVWCAHDRALGRKVAIKLLAERFGGDDAATERFMREARAAARLSGHPHVVMIYDVDETKGEPGGRAFIVMEHLAGGTVADALRLQAARPTEAIRWVREAASALDYAHERGVLHRDIKPANLLLDRARVLHVADFGIASLGAEDTITGSGQVLGTAAYLAPERALGRPTTEASDRYSLAVAAFELLVGERPFTARHFTAQARQHVEQDPPAASSRNRSLPPAVDAVLARGMAKRPERRWPTAQAFAQALEKALSEPVTRSYRIPAGAAAATPAQRVPAATAAARPYQRVPAAARPAATPRRRMPAAAGSAAMAGRRIQGASGPAATGGQRIQAASEPAATGGQRIQAASAAPATARQRTPASSAAAGRRMRSSAPPAGAVAAGTGRRGRPARRRISALAALAAGAAVAAVAIGTLGGGRQEPLRVTGGVPRPPAVAGRQLAAAKPKRPATTPAEAPAHPRPGPTITATQAASTAAPPLPDTLEARGHQLMLVGDYSGAVAVLRQAVAAASPGSLTYAYALYDLGRSMRLGGDPGGAATVLYQRLQIPNQTEAVRLQLQLALQALGRQAQNSASAPTSAGTQPGAGAPPAGAPRTGTRTAAGPPARHRRHHSPGPSGVPGTGGVAGSPPAPPAGPAAVLPGLVPGQGDHGD